MLKPNIFKYATKELSQDAFIFWLLDHANPIYEKVDSKIQQCALQLINEFFILENRIFPKEIIKFELIKQYKNIDILLKINEFSIIIEDKTGSKSHGDQLIRYKNIISSEIGEENVLAIYFKTHDQSNYKKETEDGFKVFTRDNLINILNTINGVQSDIFNDFKEYIQGIENEVNAFVIKENWNHKNWIGFFKFLQKELNRGDWGYVSNPNGGFMGYWWAFQKNDHCWQYLQIQQNELVLKINSHQKENDTKYRNLCYKHYLESANNDNLPFTKPSRFGKGETMTILTTEYLIRNKDTNLIDLEKTLKNIQRYTLFIEQHALKADSFI